MLDQKNTLLAIVLSALVLLVWQYFFGMPQIERQRQLAQQQAQQQTQQAPNANTAPQGPSPQSPAQNTAPPAPAAQTPAAQPPAAQPLTREAALAASPRIAIETPRLKRSIALKGARIDE
ncbi:MAG: membrane protein insertase YidC, partial [Variibacter sp.]|nr:membrane protein insertase YidC [Variibacter sp.]